VPAVAGFVTGTMTERGEVGQDSAARSAIGFRYRKCYALGRETDQGEIGIVVDGVYYPITRYDTGGESDTKGVGDGDGATSN
jgi:hypothetical protein